MTDYEASSNKTIKTAFREEIVERAFNSFKSKFDETDLREANSEVSYFLNFADFNPKEKQTFLSKVKKELDDKNVNLDVLS
jgi:hypothetical protein